MPSTQQVAAGLCRTDELEASRELQISSGYVSRHPRVRSPGLRAVCDCWLPALTFSPLLCFVPAATYQPVYHLLQLRQPRGALSKEDHRAGVLVLLHPRQDDAESSQQSLPRLQKWLVSKPRVIRSVSDTFTLGAQDSAAERRLQTRCPGLRQPADSLPQHQRNVV